MTSKIFTYFWLGLGIYHICFDKGDIKSSSIYGLICLAIFIIKSEVDEIKKELK